jgi:ribosomal protein L29
MKSKKELEILRSLSYTDLVKELNSSRKEIFDLKMKSSLTGDFKPHLVSSLRKKIARIKFLMSLRRSDSHENK